MKKEIKIQIPEDMEIDWENSTFETIILKPKQSPTIHGYIIDDTNSNIYYYTGPNTKDKRNVFKTKQQAKSALAMAQITQIMENNPEYGGIVTDKEWKYNQSYKYIINRYQNKIEYDTVIYQWHLLAFHTGEQRNKFYNDHKTLIKDYLMTTE